MTDHTLDPNANIVAFNPDREPKRIFNIRKQPHHNDCPHTQLTVDEPTDTVQCGLCGEVLSPMWALKTLANRHSRLFFEYSNLVEKANKAEMMNRCKCMHCGEMTKIVKER